MESETSRPARDLARIEAEAKNNGVKDLKQEHKNRSSCPELENDHDIKKNSDPLLGATVAKPVALHAHQAN